MRGTYRFYQYGTLLAEAENLITDAGKRHILRYLAGEEPSLAGSIAVGAGTAEPLGSDTRLTYEFDRATIYLVSPSYIDNKIIFKSTLDRVTVGSIYEVGLYSTSFGSFSTGNPSRSLAAFEQSIEAWSGGEFAAGSQRLGTQALRLSTAASGTVTSTLPSVGLDLSGYANTDQITIAFHCEDVNASSVRLRLHSAEAGNYYEVVVASPVQGYNVRSFTKASLARVGSPSFSAIDSLEVSLSAAASGSAQVDFDGIRIEAFSPDIENILISRTLLNRPVAKGDRNMDIEYALEVNI